MKKNQPRPYKTYFLPQHLYPVQGFYTLTELAAVVGCSTVTLYRDIKLGRLKTVRSNGQGHAQLVPQGNAAAYVAERQKNRR